MFRRVIVTGGAGFMGSNLVDWLLANAPELEELLVVDALTYAGRLENLRDASRDPRFRFTRLDVRDYERLRRLLEEFKPDLILHLAAETHVDRSIVEPKPFMETNFMGTFSLLEAARRSAPRSRVVVVSTDEVYGDLPRGCASEEHPFKPSSPYSASKAAADLLVHAYRRTYGLDATVVRPSNNYGPRQYPEKLIPRTIIRVLHGLKAVVHGDGSQVRDWLFVGDFAEGLWAVAVRGTEWAYNLPGGNPRSVLEVVRDVLRLLGLPPDEYITFTSGRPGGDWRYCVRGERVAKLGWSPRTPWEEGLRRTVEWYLRNRWWWEPLIERGDCFILHEEPWR